MSAAYPKIQEMGAEVIGVSTDDFDTQCRFAASLRVGFPLIADTDRSICKAYGVLFLGMHTKRVTFVIDEEGIVREVLHYELRIDRHRDGVLDVLRALRGSWLAEPQ